MVVQIRGTREEAKIRYRDVRATSHALCEPLAIEDYVIQCMTDVSPPKWNLGHTTWFFETFLLQPFEREYRPFHPQYGFLFNSYYQQVGNMHARPQRGFLSRPTVEEIYQYRRNVDARMEALLESAAEEHLSEILSRTALGLNHEQQHQELLLMDVKYNLSRNPLRPAYRADLPRRGDSEVVPFSWLEQVGGDGEFGHSGAGFAYDNECPRHTALVANFQLGSRLVTNGEFMEFIDAGCYRNPEFWLSDGWTRVQEEQWHAPLYWEQIDGTWYHYTLGGMRPVDPNQPVAHVSYYEANSYAYWRGLRLPTEYEWEMVARDQSVAAQDNFLESGWLHPLAARPNSLQLFGDLWELTQSPYSPYPGYRPPNGALGEYNGKFMVSQLVLRGGSCVTPRSHIRPTYRNFFYPHMRWCFQGFRLAKDA